MSTPGENPAGAPQAAARRAPTRDLVAIVPAGGAGTRLWPLSRQSRPKFLLDLIGTGRTLLQQTWDRLVPITGPDGVMLVTGLPHAAAVAAQLPDLPADNLLAEPSPRDSAAAICLAAAVVEQRHPGTIVGSFAADHLIRDVPAFHSVIAEAVAVARSDYIVVIGIEPDHPSTAFGYILTGDPLDLIGAPSARTVWHFAEKPDPDTAVKYVEQGGYRWNAGMFVARARVLLAELERHRPALHAGVTELARVWDTDRREAALAEIWPGLEAVAIDYAVAEPAAASGRVAVIPTDLGWADIGDWSSLAGLLPAAADQGLRVLGGDGQVLAEQSDGLAVSAGGRLVAVLGVDDVVVIDTPDAVLVTTRDRAQDVKRLIDRLRAAGRDDLL
jgi:mannose-1-phosphate guanylyltransferase